MVYQLSPTGPARSAKDDSFGVQRQMKIAAVCGLLLVGGLGTWGTTAQLNSAIIGSGLVKVDREVKTAQHQDGGTLAELFVKPGQTVAAGAPLLRLDTYELESQLRLRHAQLLDLKARAARLTAVRDDLPALIVPTEYSDASSAPVFDAEAQLMQRERQARDSKLAAMKLQRDGLELDISALESRMASVTAELAIVSDSIERTRKLVEKGSVPSSQLDEAEMGRIRLDGEQGEMTARLAGMAGQIAELDLQISRLLPDTAYEAHRTLREIEPRITEIEQEVTLLQSRIDRSVIRAPAGGVVNEVPVNTVGQVISPGQTIATIVPQDADLVIEFRIAPTDIDQIGVGQEARLRFAAFNQRTTPEIAGKVTRVAAASQTDPATGMEYFAAEAAPLDTAALPATSPLVPGMPVEVYIQTSARTPFDYFLQPIQDSFTKAMTEQ